MSFESATDEVKNKRRRRRRKGRLYQKALFPQPVKPRISAAYSGTAKAVPFQNAFLKFALSSCPDTNQSPKRVFQQPVKPCPFKAYL